MLNFCESFTTLSFSQESPDKMPPDPHCSSDLPVSHHLSTGSAGCNSLPSADHALPWQLSSYIPMKSYSMHRLQSFLTLSPNFRSAHQQVSDQDYWLTHDIWQLSAFHHRIIHKGFSLTDVLSEIVLQEERYSKAVCTAVASDCGSSTVI